MSSRRVLVTGGAGYIGSHTVRLLSARGYDVQIVDDLSYGHRHSVDEDRLHVLDISNTEGLVRLLEWFRPDAVIHFAAFISVGESMEAPGKYFANNTAGSLSLLNAMLRTGVGNIVFSSTAAVYGMPSTVPILEDFPYAPVNPYGESKVMVEKMLSWFDRIHGLRSVSLRYFNASGADPEGGIGEEHNPETHLIPLLFRAVRTAAPVTVFGEDYPTPDGTCIRDYVHVNDLAEAHILALEYLISGGASDAFNVGIGTGYSVREVITAVERVTGRKVPYTAGPRRAGDPASLVAGSGKLRSRLDWSPRFAALDDIVRTAWAFEQSRNHR